jgi:hypothetical protein
MKQIKIFGGIRAEKEINTFLKTNQNKYDLIDIKVYSLNDFYEDGRICNQLIEYVVIYEAIK